MLPEVRLTRRVIDADATLLQKCFSPGVIKVAANEQGASSRSLLTNKVRHHGRC
jgi:hypothetical protein